MKDYIKNMLKTQYTIQVLIVGILFMVASIFVFREIFTYVAFICFFTVFDVCGYGNMIELTGRYEDQTILTPYRIMQNMFMVIIFIAVYHYVGLKCLVACFTGWWCGGCDLLYYVLLKIKVREQDHYWMKGWSVWIVITYVKRILLADEYIGKVEFITVCSIGLILGGLINYVRI